MVLSMEFGPGVENWTEAQFQRAVIDVAAFYGWSYRYHTYDSRRSEIGFPDLVLVKPGTGILFLELKVGKNRPSEEQVSWLRGLRQSAVHAYCVYPKDLDLIQGLLRNEYAAPNLSGATRKELVPLIENEFKIAAKQVRRKKPRQFPNR
jgi:hypothetical protein